jgi:hypothetical protein
MAAVIIARSAVLESILENEVINMISPFGYPALGRRVQGRMDVAPDVLATVSSRRAGRRGTIWCRG